MPVTVQASRKRTLTSPCGIPVCRGPLPAAACGDHVHEAKGTGNPVSSGRRRFPDRAGRRHPHPPWLSGHRGACSKASRFRDAGRRQHRSTEATTAPSTMTGRSAVMRRMKGNRHSAQAPVCFGQSRSIGERSGAGAGARGSWRGPFRFPVHGGAHGFLPGSRW